MSRGGSARGVRAGRAYVELGVNNKMSKGLEAAGKQLRDFGVQVAKVGAAMTGIGTVVTGAMAVAVRGFANAGDQIDKARRRTGMTAEALSELAVAANLSDTSLDDLVRSMVMVNRRAQEAADGSVTASRAFARIGLSVNDVRSAHPDDLLGMIADGLQAIPSDGERAAAAMDIFGRSGANLLPMLDGGSAGLTEMRRRAAQLGLTLSGETARSAAETKDALTLMALSIGRVRVEIGARLAKPAIKIANVMAGMASSATAWAGANGRLIRTIALIGGALVVAGTVVAAFGAAAIGLGLALKLTAIAVGALATPVVAITAILVGVVAPAVATAAAIFGVGKVFTTTAGTIGLAAKYIGERFQAMLEAVRDTVSGIVSALSRGDMESAIEIAGSAMEVAWSTSMLKMREIWSGFRNWMQTSLVGLGSKMAQILAGALADTTSIWTRAMATWREVFARTSGFIRESWTKTTTWIAEQTAEAFAGDGVSADDIRRGLQDQEGRDVARIRQETTGSVQDIHGDRDSELDEIADRYRERMEGILATEDATLKAIEGSADNQITAAQERLEAAKKRLEEALKEEQRREEAEGGTGGAFQKLRDAINGFSDDLQMASSGLARDSIQGSFRASELRNLAPNTQQQTMNRTANATERTARNTDRLVAEVRNGGTFD